MSKVKQPIEEARAYAESSERAVAAPDSTVDFSSLEKVSTATHEIVGKTTQITQDVLKMGADLERLSADRQTMLNDFMDTFQWSELAPRPPDSLNTRAELLMVPTKTLQMSDTSDVIKDPQKREGDCLRTAQELLNEVAKPIDRPSRKVRLIEEFDTIHSELLGRKELTQVLIDLCELAHTDVFALLRTEIKQVDEELAVLRQDLANFKRLKEDAAVDENIPVIEAYTLRELEIQENVISKTREKLTTIYAANSDAVNFRNNYATARESGERACQEAQEFLTELHENLKRDLETISSELDRLCAEDDKKCQEHVEEIRQRTDSLQVIVRKQTDLWIQIEKLLKDNEQLEKRREEETQQLLNQQVAEKQRHAEATSLCDGMTIYLQKLAAAKELAAHASRYFFNAKLHTEKMCAKIEMMDVEEEMKDIREQEQLSYLDAYGAFKRFADELLLKKETRLMSLGRLARNLELQVKEATHVLDPNKKKYEAELVEVRKEMEATQKTIEELKERARVQAELWRPTEDLLEESGIEFEPPDIAAERERCQRKTESLELARAFVSSEQETVDRDTMKLRKLKTSNKVAIDGVEKRRKEKHGTENEPQAIGDQPPASPQEAAQPANAPPADAAASDSHTQAAEPPK